MSMVPSELNGSAAVQQGAKMPAANQLTVKGIIERLRLVAKNEHKLADVAGHLEDIVKRLDDKDGSGLRFLGVRMNSLTSIKDADPAQYTAIWDIVRDIRELAENLRPGLRNFPAAELRSVDQNLDQLVKAVEMLLKVKADLHTFLHRIIDLQTRANRNMQTTGINVNKVELVESAQRANLVQTYRFVCDQWAKLKQEVKNSSLKDTNAGHSLLLFIDRKERIDSLTIQCYSQQLTDSFLFDCAAKSYLLDEAMSQSYADGNLPFNFRESSRKISHLRCPSLPLMRHKEKSLPENLDLGRLDPEHICALETLYKIKNIFDDMSRILKALTMITPDFIDLFDSLINELNILRRNMQESDYINSIRGRSLDKYLGARVEAEEVKSAYYKASFEADLGADRNFKTEYQSAAHRMQEALGDANIPQAFAYYSNSIVNEFVPPELS